jgi:hypothetical protein
MTGIRLLLRGDVAGYFGSGYWWRMLDDGVGLLTSVADIFNRCSIADVWWCMCRYHEYAAADRKQGTIEDWLEAFYDGDMEEEDERGPRIPDPNAQEEDQEEGKSKSKSKSKNKNKSRPKGGKKEKTKVADMDGNNALPTVRTQKTPKKKPSQRTEL